MLRWIQSSEDVTSATSSVMMNGAIAPPTLNPEHQQGTNKHTHLSWDRNQF